MQIDGAANVAAFSKLIDPGPRVQAQLGVAVLKQALSGEAAVSAQLIQSLDPARGQHVDLRV